MPTWTVHLEPDPDRSTRKQILAALSAYNEVAGGPGNFQTLAVTVRNLDGTVAGGL